jgi:hypothetical protein
MVLIAAAKAAVLQARHLWARPSLLNQKGQVVYPIVFTYPARIYNMGQIVFSVRDNKIGVRH